MSEPQDFQPRPDRSWGWKFQDAFRGLGHAWRTQSSFWVHGVVLVLVIACGFGLGVSRIEWCLLLLCIAFVLAVEALNTSIELLAKEVDRRFNPQIGRALDIASGAVLTAALGAASVGLIIFIRRLAMLLGWL